MSLSRSLSHYNDVRKMLNDALTEPDGSFHEFETSKAANYWRRRAHQFRRLLIKIDEVTSGFGNGISPYDDLIITVEDTTIFIRVKIAGVMRSIKTGEIVKAPEDQQSSVTTTIDTVKIYPSTGGRRKGETLKQFETRTVEDINNRKEAAYSAMQKEEEEEERRNII